MSEDALDALFAPRPPSPALVERTAEKGWPDDLLGRMLRLHVSFQEIEWFLDESRDAAELGRWVERQESLTFGTLRVREATGRDRHALVDLFANAPEDVGEWEVTVERGPDPFAQFRLQETVSLRVLEDRGVILGAMAMSWRNTFAGGRRLCVQAGQALRVRRECRGRSYGSLVLDAPVAATLERPSAAGCPYVRAQNFNAAGFFTHTMPEFFQGNPEREHDVPGIPVTVLSYPRRPFSGEVTGIRRARVADLGRCARLINRTHRGQDLFRPYTAAYLRDKLDEWAWGEKPPWWESVYGWADVYVLERDGELVACAGLWDRGKHVREAWRHKQSGAQRVVTATAVLDLGFAEGHDAAAARLIEYLIGETERFGRDFLMVALDQLPELARHLEGHQPVAETRGLVWRVWDGDGGQMAVPDPPLTRPHTDLAYW